MPSKTERESPSFAISLGVEPRGYISITRARRLNHPRRLKKPWQKRLRQEQLGLALQLRVELKMLLPGKKRLQYLCIEPGWAITATTPAAARYVRQRLQEVMIELDRTTVIEDPPIVSAPVP